MSRGPARSAAVLLALLALPAGAATEAELKAAVLYRVLHFVEWPVASAGPIRVCVAGEEPLDGALEALAGQRVAGRSLELLHPETPGPASCDVLFVGRGDAGGLPGAGGGPGVLTVSDAEDFGCAGGMVTLRVLDGRIRFSVNHASAAAAGLRLSAKLLELATPLPCGGPA